MASKGTGRTRQVLSAHQQWRGGVVFGPTPTVQGTASKLPQKVRRLALKSVYSEKVAENKFVAVDALSFYSSKTAEFAKVLAALSIDSKFLLSLKKEMNSQLFQLVTFQM